MSGTRIVGAAARTRSRSSRSRSRTALEAELRTLRERLAEAEATLHAIGNDDVDAFVVTARESRELQVLTIGSAQQPYEHMLDCLSDGVLTLDDTGTVLHASRRVLEMSGRDVLTGRAASELFADPTTVHTLVQNAGIEPLVLGATVRSGPEQRAVPVRLSATVLPLRGPRRIGVVVSQVEPAPSSRASSGDFTEAPALAGLGRVLQQLPVGVLLVEPATGNVRYANRLAEEILGRALVGTERPVSLVELSAWRPDGSITEGDQLPVARVLAGEPLAREALVRFRPDGTLVYTRTTAAPLLDDDGELEAILVALEDATPEYIARIEREENERFRELFIGMLGHDLRDPLSAVMAGIALLRQAEPTDRARATLDRIGRTTQRMTRMVNQLLDFTRARLGGGIPVRRAPTGLPGVVQRVVAELAASHPGTRIETAIDGLVLGEWDADRLEQIVSNLVSNAVVHSTPGEPVRIDVREEGAIARLSVHNGGPAIPADLLPHLFDPFRRGSGAAGSGVGLGLYIAQQIVRAHGGTITVDSTEDRGTTFVVRLPRVV